LESNRSDWQLEAEHVSVRQFIKDRHRMNLTAHADDSRSEAANCASSG
jgi:hypothetical protein